MTDSEELRLGLLELYRQAAHLLIEVQVFDRKLAYPERTTQDGSYSQVHFLKQDLEKAQALLKEVKKRLGGFAEE